MAPTLGFLRTWASFNGLVCAELHRLDSISSQWTEQVEVQLLLASIENFECLRVSESYFPVTSDRLLTESSGKEAATEVVIVYKVLLYSSTYIESWP